MRDTVITMAERRNELGERVLITQTLNDTYREVCQRARLLHDSRTITLADSPDVNLTAQGITDMQQLRRVAYTGAQAYGTIDLEPCDLETLLNLRSVQGATPGWTRVYNLDGDTLRLFPSGSSGETLTLYIVAQPDEMNADDDEPTSVPSEFHKVIVDGAIAACAKHGAVRSEYRSYFEDGVTKLRVYANTRTGEDPAPARFGRWRRPVPHDRSYYGGGYS